MLFSLFYHVILTILSILSRGMLFSLFYHVILSFLFILSSFRSQFFFPCISLFLRIFFLLFLLCLFLYCFLVSISVSLHFLCPCIPYILYPPVSESRPQLNLYFPGSLTTFRFLLHEKYKIFILEHLDPYFKKIK